MNSYGEQQLLEKSIFRKADNAGEERTGIRKRLEKEKRVKDDLAASL